MSVDDRESLAALTGRKNASFEGWRYVVETLQILKLDVGHKKYLWENLVL